MQPISLESKTSTLQSSPSRPISTLPPRRVRRIVEFMEANLSECLGIKAIAQVSGYSETHFLRMFRASTGVTPHQYLIERRVRRARQMLAQSTATLPEIADHCGFSSQSHLATVFRRQVGTTPTAYRRAARQERTAAKFARPSWLFSSLPASWNQDQLHPGTSQEAL